MDVGIIGTGSVGSALAAGLRTAGHDVVVGSREPERNRIEGAEVATHQTAIDHGEVVILAVPAGVITDVATTHREDLGGKVVIDAANEYPTATSERSLAARVADAAPDANVVKAFNTIGANLMTDPVVSGDPATMFLAGDETAAVETARTLAGDLGFDPVVAGGLDAATHLEHLARFWIDLSQQYGRDIAFRLLREPRDE